MAPTLKEGNPNPNHNRNCFTIFTQILEHPCDSLRARDTPRGALWITEQKQKSTHMKPSRVTDTTYPQGLASWGSGWHMLNEAMKLNKQLPVVAYVEDILSGTPRIK